MKVLFAKRCWEDWCTSDMFTAKEQPVPRNSPAQPNMAEVVEQEAGWIEVTFKKRECVKFIQSASTCDGLSRCGCGRIRSDHLYLNKRAIGVDELPLGASACNFSQVKIVKTDILTTGLKKIETTSNLHEPNCSGSLKWDISNHTAAFPTDAYGTLEFQGTGEGDKSKFIRLSHDTIPDRVLQLLIDEWKLRPPKMVITVHGGAHNFQVQPKLHRVFCNGLMKAANTTGAWIMSFGLNTGVGAIVGNALKEHKAKFRGKIVSIGVAPWGVVDHRDDLVGSQPISAYQTMDNPLSKGSVLHAAHTHFLLVDNGMEGRYDSELRFRRHLERRLSLQQTSRQGRTCPVVCLVLEGGKNTINVVLESVRQSPPIPVIVCDGSGRAADLLAFAHQYADDDGSMLEELRVQLLVLVQETFKCSKEQAQYIFISILECVKKKELITIFRMGQGYNQDDIDIAILTATLKAQCKSAPDMLNLALAWNRIDIAKSHIFVYGRQWPVLSLEQAMMDALIGDRVDFVKLLMENGVSMHKFLTISRLEELYNAKPPLHLVYLVKDVKKSIQPNYRFTLIDIGQVIELLMGAAYRSSYTRKRFRLHYAAKAPAPMKKQLSFRLALNSFGNSNATSKADTNAAPQGIEMPLLPSKSEPNHSLSSNFSYPFHELLVWAVLMKRQKMALFMWQQGEEAIAKALVACKLYKTMAKEAADDDLDVEESEQLKKYAKEFKGLAIQLLEICYRTDDDATQYLLTQELKHWSKQTCLSLAIAASHRDFIAHPCVQLLLNDLWMGGLSERKNSGMKVIVGILLPPFILTLAFKSQEELQLMPQTVAEHLHEVSSSSSSTIAGSSSSSSTSSSSSSSSSKSSNSMITKPEILGRDQEQDAYYLLTSRPKQLTLSKKIYEFYNAPITKFWMYVMSYSIVLVLFTYVVLVRLNDFPSIPEWIVISHAFTVAIEITREIFGCCPGSVVQKFKVWGSRFWNVLDAATIIMFFIAFGFRMSPENYVMLVGRSVYCANIVLWYTRLFNIFSVNKRLGPYVMLMGKMMIDMGTFIILLAIVLVGFGVSRQAVLHPNETASWTLLKDVVLEPYFMLYGEVYAGTIDPCFGDDPTLCVVGSWIAPTFMFLYLLVANILLLNLLIAVFNNTFARVKNHSDKIWKFQRYLTIVEFELRPLFPPPLVLISYVSMIIGRLCKKRKNSSSDRGLKLFLDDEDVEKLHDFEEECVDEFFRAKDNTNLPETLGEKQVGEENVPFYERFIEVVENMYESEVALTEHIVDLNQRLADIEDMNMKLLGRHMSGSSSNVRSRKTTGCTETHPDSDRNQNVSELGVLPAVNPVRSWCSLRQRSRMRQDSELSSTSDWHPLHLGRVRNKSSDKTKIQSSHVDKPLRRTNSAGALREIPSVYVSQCETKSFFAPNFAVPEDNKSLSCQNIRLLPPEQKLPKFSPSDSWKKDGLSERIASSGPAGLPHQQKEMASGETCQDVDDADSTCSGVWFRGQRADSSNDLPEAASSMHFTPARSQADLTTRIMTEGQAPFAKSANPSHSSAVSKSNAQTPGGPVVEKKRSFRRLYGNTPTLTIGPTPTSSSQRPTYKSITDKIDISSWHEIHAPITPATPLDRWWKAPDFSQSFAKYSDQTSLSEWDEEDGFQNLVTKKHRKEGKHKKRIHRKRDTASLALLEEHSLFPSSLPTTPDLGKNRNNNSSQSSTLPRERRNVFLINLRKCNSQSDCSTALQQHGNDLL